MSNPNFTLLAASKNYSNGYPIVLSATILFSSSTVADLIKAGELYVNVHPMLPHDRALATLAKLKPLLSNNIATVYDTTDIDMMSMWVRDGINFIPELRSSFLLLQENFNKLLNT